MVAELVTQYGCFTEKIIFITKPQKLHLIDYKLESFKEKVSQKKNYFKKGV